MNDAAAIEQVKRYVDARWAETSAERAERAAVERSMRRMLTGAIAATNA